MSWLGAQAVARAANSVMYSSNAKENDEEYFGFDLLLDEDVVVGRSGISGWDYQSPPAPLDNVPPVPSGDTHQVL